MQQAFGQQHTWLVTGAAGFIGSHLVQTLLQNGQRVIALDNLSTGHKANLDQVANLVGSARSNLRWIEGDIRSLQTCESAVEGVDFVLHQAALGSVPRSLVSPLNSFDSNVTGFMNMLDAARRARVRRFVYASSSSVYGDHPDLPKHEGVEGRVLSPYAATKAANELMAYTYARSYGLGCVGLRYFNVFGARQDPSGAYAAVIPKWASSLVRGEQVFINGDGSTSRDFCFVANAVQANILAAVAPMASGAHEAYNVAYGAQTTLLELFDLIKAELVELGVPCQSAQVSLRDFRAGDVLHSLANIDKAKTHLGYEPTHSIRQGLRDAMRWYVA
jgi:UDP-N-acetylglucosamine/UDP-N-acetylgalactosamine 4-epimerase